VDLERLLADRAAAAAACRRWVSPDDAEDCASDAVCALLATRAPVPEQRAWLCRVALRRAADVRRRQRRDRRLAVRARSGGEAARELERVEDEALARWLAARCADLPATTRAVLAATADGRSPAETARGLAITVRAAQSHLYRCRRVLRRAAIEE
jgi:DNA-directed RNA polymerase specialized sigma24 family protein